MSETTAEPVLRVEDLSVSLVTHCGMTGVVDSFSTTIWPGEKVGLVGESGCGKSVTSLALMGLIPPRQGRVTGSVRLEGRELVGCSDRELENIRGNRIAMVFQEPMTSLNPAYTIGDQIAETVRRHQQLSRRDATKRSAELLDMVGIPNAAARARAYPHEFSGGMQQRAMIAMAVSCDPAVLIADEPTTALDVTVQAQILDVLDEMRERLGMALVMITHDLGVVGELCDRLLVMYAGQVVEQSDCASFFAGPRHPYGEGLLAAMPRLDSVDAELATIPGRPPAPGTSLPGCRFAPRCPYTTARCTREAPSLVGPPGRAHRCVRADELHLRGVA